METMRDIELKGKVFKNTRQTVDALAWATNRRGRITWIDDRHVVGKIRQYLIDHHVKLHNDNAKDMERHIRLTINRLVNEGYAEAKGGGVRNALTSFRFKDDVNITGYTPIFVDPNKPEVVSVYDGATPEPVTPPITHQALMPNALANLSMPLPEMPKPDRYMKAEVDRLLERWAEFDPDSYANWVDQLMQRLGVVLG
jgi:hypothetical protein